MTTKAEASIIADRLSSALSFPRRPKASIRGEDFGIALSEARSMERRSHLTREPAGEKVAPESRKTAKAAPKPEEQVAADDSVGASAQDQAAQPTDGNAVGDSNAPLSGEKESAPADETVNSDDSEATDPLVVERDGSSSQSEETREGHVESSGTAENTQAAPAKVTVSPDALLLKALEVGTNPGQALRNDSNGQPIQPEPSPSQASGPVDNTARVTFDQNAFTGNTGSEPGQEQTDQRSDQESERGGQQYGDATIRLSFDSEGASGQTSDKRQDAEPVAISSQKADSAPQISLQDIKASIQKTNGPQHVRSDSNLQGNADQVTQASVTSKDSAAPREFNLANELAKALLPEQPEHSSGSRQASSTPAGEAGTSSNSLGQNAGNGVPVPQGVRVIAGGGATQSAPATFGVDATGGKATIEQIVRVTQSSTNQQTSHVRLQLDPPELGQLRIDVKAHQGNLSLQIEADTQAAKSILESRMGELRNALQREGIHVERFDIEVKNTHQSQTEDSQGKRSGDNHFGRETNPQDQANEQSSGRRGAGTEDDSFLTGHGEGLEFEDPESVAVSEQLVLSGFDVTA
jgi:flagellar hook-length control protein FliK